MATQVEVGSALPSLTTRSELTSEAKLQNTFAGGSLSSTSSKPGELPSPFSPLILEEKSKFGNPLRPATMPPIALRPRLTPKPFSRDKSSDTFSVVKPPVPTFKPSNVAPTPPAFAKTFEDMTVVKGLSGNVPPLVDQKSIEDKGPSELVASMPFDSSPQANTVILFETGKSEKARMKFTPEKSYLGSPQTGGPLQAPEEQLTPSESEVFCRTPGIHRQLSFSSESSPVSWDPCVSLEKKDNLEKGKVLERQYSAGVSPAHEVHLRPKQRPVSAIFLESLKDQKQCCLEAAYENSPPEKTWVRKPRPLSMDLTAKFEKRDLSLQRAPCPTESKEKSMSPEPAQQGSARSPERWMKNEARALGRADPSKSSLKSPDPLADLACVLNPKAFLSEEASSCQSIQEDFPQDSARDRKGLWESRLKRHGEQKASEMEAETAPGKVKEPPSVKGQSVKDRAALSPKEPCAARNNSVPSGSDPEHQSVRDVEKPTNVLDRSANDAAAGNVESQLGSPGEESRTLNIQQRIKELTADSAGAKLGSRRHHSFRSRPLSADLTKLFSKAVTATEKLAEPNRKPAKKTQESPEMTANPLLGTDSGEARTGGMLWRPQQPVKIIPPTPGDGSFARERSRGALQGDDSPSPAADPDVHTSSTSPAGKACLKTVRATVFEHHVQRHNVATDPLGAGASSQPMQELSGACRELLAGKAAEPKTFSREVPHRQLDRSVEAENLGKANSLTKAKVSQEATWEKYTRTAKCENPTPKHVEDSLVRQRIEPRYEILQTVGKRAQSEAVAIVCEDKAVTLRSRRSLKERRKSSESFIDVSWPRRLDLKHDCCKEDGFVSKTKKGGGAAAGADAMQAFDTPPGQHVFCEHVRESDRSQIGQKDITAKASCLTARNKGVGTTEDNVPKVSSEPEKEKSRGKTEGPNVPKGSPESFGAGPGKTEGGDAGARVSASRATGSPRCVLEQHLSASGGGQRQMAGSKASHEPEESQESAFWKDPPETLDAADPHPKGHPLQPWEAEEPLKRSGRRASAGKGSERWRRKTLPHDIRFENAGPLTEDRAKGLVRRDSLQFHEGSIAKKSRTPSCIMGLSEGVSASPSNLEGRFQDQPSPLKPKATYFAVTYQIPNEAESSSSKEFAHRSRWFSSLVENGSLASNASAPRRPRPSPGGHFSSALSEAPGSLGRHFGKNCGGEEEEEAGEGDASALLQKGALNYPVNGGREKSWRSLEREAESAEGRILGTDPPPRPSPGKQRPPSYPRHFPQEGEPSGQKRKQHSACSGGGSKEKTAENYRPRVLDIDALMAEYKEDSLKPSAIWDRKEGEDSSLFPRDQCRRSSSDKTSSGYSQKDPQVLDDVPRSSGQEVYGTGVRRPENMYASERERLGGRETSSTHCGDGQGSSLPWERPPALGWPADAASTKKKTFILDEEPGAQGLLLGSSWGVKPGEYRMPFPEPLGLGLKAESGFVPHPSLAFSDSILPKGTCPKHQGTDLPPEGDGHQARGLNKRKSSVTSSPRKSSSSAAHIQAERSTSALANASPGVQHSCSEKTPQAKAKGSLPVRPEARERRDQHRCHPSFPPKQAESSRPSRRSASQQRSLFWEEKKDLEKERSRLDSETLGARSSPGLALQRRSRSFYRDRKVDHWATDQLKQCFGRPPAEAKDTDTLVQEADSQYGTWSEQRHSGGSLALESSSSEGTVASAWRRPPGSRLSSFSSQTDPAEPQDSFQDQRRSASLDRSSADVESPSGTEGPASREPGPDFSFLEPTVVLDSSALKTRVQLSKRRRQHRAPISHLLRRSSGGGGVGQPPSTTEEASSAWMFKDSTAPPLDPGEKADMPEESGEVGKRHQPPQEKLPVSQPQRLPGLPGLDHTALKVQLRRREEPEEAGDLNPAQLSRSPKSPFQPGGPGVRVLPASREKEERLEEASPSPQWLKELKSKKRQSQVENQV